jgi:hypothetical protein
MSISKSAGYFGAERRGHARKGAAIGAGLGAAAMGSLGAGTGALVRTKKK